MCFTISRDTPNPFIAEQDILVFKYGRLYECDNKEYTPYWQRAFRYYRDIPPKVIILSPIAFRDEIDQGYHAHTTLQAARDEGPEIGVFIIPKGATYYLNNDDKEIVASQLIYKGKYYSKIGIDVRSKNKTLTQLKRK